MDSEQDQGNLDFEAHDAISTLKHHRGFQILMKLCVLDPLAGLEGDMEKIPLSIDERDQKFPAWQAYRRVRRQMDATIQESYDTVRRMLNEDPGLRVRRAATPNKPL